MGTVSDAEILTSVDDPRLLEAMDISTAHSLVAFARYLDGEVYTGPDLTRYMSGIALHFLNGVAMARLPEERLDAVIEETVARFATRSLPMFWWVGPTSSPERQGERLQAHGLTPEDGPPGMAVNISALGQPVAIPRVNIVRVISAEGAAQWARTAVPAYGLPTDGEVVMERFTTRACAEPDSPLVLHLAYLDGQPVATCMTFLYAGVAGIYSVATLPVARRLGIGGEITRLALLHAGNAGYKVGVLQSSPMGYNVYSQLGFATYTRYKIYSWTPPEICAQ